MIISFQKQNLILLVHNWYKLIMSNEVKQMYRAFLDRINKLYYLYNATLKWQAFYYLVIFKFSVFISCLMTKAINSSLY